MFYRFLTMNKVVYNNRRF